jgi:hypothetical protein
MYDSSTWGLVEQAYDFLDREFPGRHVAQSQVTIRFSDPTIGYDEFEVIFSDCIVRFRGGKGPRKLAKGTP